MHPDRTNLPNGLRRVTVSRTGRHVGDYKMAYDAGWELFSEEMLTYCVQDVAANVSIFKAQEEWINANWKLVNFEQKVAEICSGDGQTPASGSTESAEKLEYTLSSPQG